MKKLLFILVFNFIGEQAFSQIYLITLSHEYDINSCVHLNNEITLSKITPAGVATHICINREISQGLITLNSEINSIISQGYKLIETSYSHNNYGGNGGLQRDGLLQDGTTFIFAIP